MEKLSPNEKLDAVLYCLDDEYRRKHSHVVAHFHAIEGVSLVVPTEPIPVPFGGQGNKGFLILLDIYNRLTYYERSHVDDLMDVLAHLEGDGMIKIRVVDNEKQYCIQFSGSQFLANGGYEGRQKQNKVLEQLSLLDLQKTDRELKRMNTIFWIAIAGLSISVLSLLKDFLAWYIKK